MRALVAERLAGRGAERIMTASPRGEAPATPVEAMVPAAVLVPLIDRRDGMTVLLTQRTEHLNDHAGQISFPGGRVEDRDADPIDTALRETEEEIGLTRDRIEVVGCLDTCVTGTGFKVVPVVGLVTPPFTLTLDSFEVADTFEVPLDFVLDPANHERREAVFDGVGRREFYVLPYRDRYIWGATARMLVNLHELLMG